MSKRTFLLMFVAVACGLVASLMTSKLLSEKNASKTNEPQEEVGVLYSAHNLTQGMSTKDPVKMFKVKWVPKGEEPKKAIRANLEGLEKADVEKKLFDLVKDRRMSRPVPGEQWIQQEDLMSTEQAGLSATMQKGMRALGVKVDTSAVAGGFVLPNSRVDVVWVQRRGDADSTARVILQNVLVLAVGTQSQRPEDKQALIESTVTLAVKPEDAEKLTLASEMGSLRLILRPFGDDELVTTSGVDPKKLSGGGSSADITGDLPGEEPTVPPTRPRVWTNLPTLPETKPTEGTAKAKEEPLAIASVDTKTFYMTIHNGEKVNRVKFVLGDELGETTREEIQKSQLTPPPGPSATPPSPAVPGPATPAPAPKTETPAGPGVSK